MEQEASDGCVTEKTSPSQLLGINSNIHYCFCPAQLLRDFSGAIVWKLLVSNRGCEICHCCPKMLLQPRTTQCSPAPQRHPLPLGAAVGQHQAQRWGKIGFSSKMLGTKCMQMLLLFFMVLQSLCQCPACRVLSLVPSLLFNLSYF